MASRRVGKGIVRKALKACAFLLLIVFAGIQFVRPSRTNPPEDASRTLSAAAEVPEEVNAILERSCSDCHSNRTVWPWYSNIAPVSWSVAEHVEHGREELNFSEWGSYSDSRKKRKLEEICEEVEEGQMPHPQYTWIHRDAALSSSDISALCAWTRSAAGSG